MEGRKGAKENYLVRCWNLSGALCCRCQGTPGIDGLEELATLGKKNTMRMTDYLELQIGWRRDIVGLIIIYLL